MNEGKTLKFLLYFKAKVIRGSIRDSLLMNRESDRIATHQTIGSLKKNYIETPRLTVFVLVPLSLNTYLNI